MAHFHILHISDLHLDSKNKVGDLLPTTARKLIESAVDNLRDHGNIIVVISGDIIHQGNYSSENTTLAIDFFKELKKQLDPNNDKIISVQIVPGNHDKDFTEEKDKSNANQMLSFALQNISEFNKDEKKLRELLGTAYAKFYELKKEVIKTLYPSSPLITSEQTTYYVDSVEITDKFKKKVNNKDEEVLIDPSHVVFINVDTTLASELRKEKEKGKLVIGKVQVDELKKQVAQKIFAIKNNHPELKPLIFCVSHHPIDYLSSIRWSENADEEESQHESQYELFYDALTGENKFNADFLLNGHVHTRNYSDISNRSQKVSVLTTGIGWPDSDNLTVSKFPHYYSIYTFNGYDDAYIIKMFVSESDESFRKDNTIGDMPLYVPTPRYKAPFIWINTTNGNEDENRYMIDYPALQSIKLLNNCMSRFSRRAGYKRLTMVEEIRAVDGKAEYGLLWNYYFSNLLQIFESNFYDFFGKDIEYRIVLRAYDKATFSFLPVLYEPVIGNYKPKTDFKWENTNQVEPNLGQKEISLIQHAYSENRALIHSVNAQYNRLIPTHWDDYLVFTIPNFNITADAGEQTRTPFRYDTKPGISIGISLRRKNQDDKTDIKRKLFLLQYFGIKKCFDDLIESAWKYCVKFSSDIEEAKRFSKNEIIDYLVSGYYMNNPDISE